MPSPSGTKIVSNFSNYAKHNMANNGWANSKGREYFTTPQQPLLPVLENSHKFQKGNTTAESRE